MVRVRFAPSPTGTLHIGGARTALFNYLFARKQGGTFILRIDDTDLERSKAELEADILSSMRWLGMDWDEGPDAGGDYGPYRQSERQEIHLAAAKKLIDSDKAYVDDEGATRLRYPSEEIVVNDEVCGECVFATDALGPEPVILRSNGTPTYHLASVSDDVEMKITHIIRGQDHLTNTAKHQVLFEALGYPVPTFAHLPLILGQDGSKLSKRNSEGLTSVTEFKEEGFIAPALNNFLMLLGWSHPDGAEQLTIQECTEVFDLGRVNQTAAIFDDSKLRFLNGWWIRHADLEPLAKEALEFAGEYKGLVEQRGTEYWREAFGALRDGLAMMTDVETLAAQLLRLDNPLSEKVLERFSDEDERGQAVQLMSFWLELLQGTALQPESDCYNTEQFSELFRQAKKKFSFNKKLVFQSLRVAVMGELSGPELKVLVPFIPRELLLARAEQAIAALS